MSRPQYTEDLAETFFNLKEQGLSYNQIAEQTGHTAGFVRNCLIRLGKPFTIQNAWTTGKRIKQTEEQLKRNACERTLEWRKKQQGLHIYKIVLPDNTYYIGSTKQGARNRFNDHIKNAMKQNPFNSRWLHKHFLDGGTRQELKLIILEEAQNENELHENELLIIKEHIDDPMCLNTRTDI